jgi:hypothetical protein
VAPGATPSVAGSAALRLDEAAQRIACGGDYLALTRYEYLLLATLLRRPGRIFSRAELMELVWADAPDTLDRTVDAHIKMLRAKLRERGLAPELIQTHRHGLRHQPPGESTAVRGEGLCSAKRKCWQCQLGTHTLSWLAIGWVAVGWPISGVNRLVPREVGFGPLVWRLLPARGT